ncbi:MAG: NAD(P)/FAD-dependent oxidoreductase [Hyphomicrobiales bacterium]|nr:NAD(P)/FAD-dependent oxidoreductase [Hyphomicrobiales bacterium]
MTGNNGHKSASRFDALIIGAGFAGLYQLHSLRDKLGLSSVVLEAGDGIGGTWYWNRYPGARCDSESHVYAYYFSDELLTEWEWTERYPAQPEIVRYLEFVANKLDLKRDIRLGTRVVSAHYLEDENRWIVTTEGGTRFEATYLIAATGCLSAANIPAIPGLESFDGEWYHTGQWPHEEVEFRGKAVGQIGTGSTGIQAAPVIAQTAKHLTVFQRTPNFSVPAHNRPLSADFKQYVRESRAEIRKLIRSTTNAHAFKISDRKVFDVSAQEREAIYEAAWEKGGLEFRACFQDLMIDKAANDTAADFLKNKIRKIVKDPETAATLTKIDHPYGTKRPPIDTDYFETFNRENVSLIDVRANPITRITPRGIETTDAAYEFDIIVFATGFDAITGPLLKMDIRGRDGLSIHKAWETGPWTYLGLQIPGFPNLFTITGPGSPSVLTNMPVAIEQHVDWITDCIADMRNNDLARIEPTAAAADAWGEYVNETASATLMPQAGHSWYHGANIPGKPLKFMPYVGGMAHYRTICDDAASRGYEGFTRQAR